MSAGEKKYVSPNCADTLHHAVCPLTYLLRRFASRAAVPEYFPVRALGEDLGQAQPLIFTVVPFHKVGIGFGHRSESGQFASSRRALQWAGEHLDKCLPLQPFPEPAGVPFAVGS